MEKVNSFSREELEKYIGEDKKKKVYSVSLTKKDVDYIKKRINVPFSKIVDDIINTIAIAIKKMEEKKKQELEGKESDIDKKK